MDYETIHENAAWELWEKVDFRHIVTALKLFKANHDFRNDDDPVYRKVCQKYLNWFLSDRNRLEKDIAMRLLLEESILENEIIDILMPDERKAGMEDSLKSFETMWESIRSREEKEQLASLHEE